MSKDSPLPWNARELESNGRFVGIKRVRNRRECLKIENADIKPIRRHWIECSEWRIGRAGVAADTAMRFRLKWKLRPCRIYIDKRAMDFLFVAKTTGNGPLQSLLSSQRISNGRITIRGAVRQRRPSLTCGRRNRMFSFCIYYDFITDVLLSAVECVLIAWWATWETNGLHRRRFGRHIGHKRPCRNKLPASAHRWTN